MMKARIGNVDVKVDELCVKAESLERIAVRYSAEALVIWKIVGRWLATREVIIAGKYPYLSDRGVRKKATQEFACKTNFNGERLYKAVIKARKIYAVFRDLDENVIRRMEGVTPSDIREMNNDKINLLRKQIESAVKSYKEGACEEEEEEEEEEGEIGEDEEEGDEEEEKEAEERSMREEEEEGMESLEE